MARLLVVARQQKGGQGVRVVSSAAAKVWRARSAKRGCFCFLKTAQAQRGRPLVLGGGVRGVGNALKGSSPAARRRAAFLVVAWQHATAGGRVGRLCLLGVCMEVGGRGWCSGLAAAAAILSKAPQKVEGSLSIFDV